MATRTKFASETGDLFAPRTDTRPATGEILSRDAVSAEEARSPPGSERQVARATPKPGAKARVATTTAAPAIASREFEYNGGIHLVDSVLWCDADRRTGLSFVSHAHVDAIGKNRRILATDKTLRILTRASGRIDNLSSPYGQSFTLGPLQLEMHPAGHVLGSAQLLVQRAGRRIVYACDVNTDRTATAEQASPIPCDVLAISATFGLPMYTFPPREAVLEDIVAFVTRCLDDRTTPVLIANQIGTSQELMHILGNAGHRLRVHRSIYDVAKVYRTLGVAMQGSRRFQGAPAKDEIVIMPPILRQHASVRNLKKYRTALVTGRAMDPGFVERHRVDEAFPLSDIVGHPELLRFIAATGANEIHLTGGHVEELGDELRKKGLRVYSLVPPRQLPLF